MQKLLAVIGWLSLMTSLAWAGAPPGNLLKGGLKLPVNAEEVPRSSDDLDKVIREATEKIAAKPTDGEAYRDRAGAHLNKGDLAKALADAIKATELSPKDAKAWTARAAIRCNQNDYNLAIDRSVSRGLRQLRYEISVAW